MGGIFTSTRVMPYDRRLRGITTKNGSVVGGQANSSYNYGDTYMGGVPTETTTSYRSGKRADGEVSDLENFGGGTWAEATAAIVQDSKSESSSLLESDNGHNFTTTKTKLVHCTQGSGTRKVGSDTWKYSGHVVPYANTGFPGFGSSSYSMSLQEAGTRAMKATMPTSSDADLAVTLAELKREGMPQIPNLGGTKAGNTGIVGEANLSYEFGFKPLAEDLANLLAATTQWRQRLEQYQRDSLKTVRRSYQFPTESNTEILSAASGQQAGTFACCSSTTSARDAVFAHPVTGVINYTAQWFRTSRQTSRQVWFDGAFTYNLNRGMGGILGKVVEYEAYLRKLTGVKFDTEVAWNLTPWSWFADWNGNIGNNIGLAESFSRDGVILKYGYVMAHTTSVIETTAIDFRGRSYTLKVLQETKQRLRSDPYGFALSIAGYTDRQWAILGSLGLTKGPKIPFWWKH